VKRFQDNQKNGGVLVKKRNTCMIGSRAKRIQERADREEGQCAVGVRSCGCGNKGVGRKRTETVLAGLNSTFTMRIGRRSKVVQGGEGGETRGGRGLTAGEMQKRKGVDKKSDELKKELLSRRGGHDKPIITMLINAWRN